MRFPRALTGTWNYTVVPKYNREFVLRRLNENSEPFVLFKYTGSRYVGEIYENRFSLTVFSWVSRIRLVMEGNIHEDKIELAVRSTSVRIILTAWLASGILCVLFSFLFPIEGWNIWFWSCGFATYLLTLLFACFYVKLNVRRFARIIGGASITWD